MNKYREMIYDTIITTIITIFEINFMLWNNNITNKLPLIFEL